MFKVTKTPHTPNMVWDPKNNRPLCKFVNGVFETDDTTTAEKLKKLGYTVEGEAPVNTAKATTKKAVKSRA